jgi:hypothetical protein
VPRQLTLSALGLLLGLALAAGCSNTDAEPTVVKATEPRSLPKSGR